MDAGSFGRCLVCAEEIDPADLRHNPTMRYCLCDLSAAQQRALERDLVLAWRIPAGLLPLPDVAHAGWSGHYRYAAAGPVGGDFCDLVPDGAASLFVAVGDVSGKGVAASLLMAHLSAAFRAGIDAQASPAALVEDADRLLLSRGFDSHYATVVYGRARADGIVDLANAGHPLPLHVGRGTTRPVASPGLPIGVFGEAPRAIASVTLAPGDLLVLYTDGVTEARNGDDEEFGLERLSAALMGQHSAEPRAAVEACLSSLEQFLSGSVRQDDLTLVVLRREG
jgi:sigma-B regulation protein RsbU (phosphoserine phosphatase)